MHFWTWLASDVASIGPQRPVVPAPWSAHFYAEAPYLAALAGREAKTRFRISVENTDLEGSICSPYDFRL